MQHKILIVEDQETSLSIILAMLSEIEEYDLITASNGKDACELANSEKPDLILMDWMLPGMSGVEAVHQLKSNENTKNIPVLMITWHNTSSRLQQAFEAGAIDYIKKPVDKLELHARIKSALNEKIYKQEIITKNEQLKAEKGKVEHYAIELERSNKDLNEFASIISHDLKEPLRKIIYLGNNLQMENESNKINSENYNCLRKVVDSARRMNQLIHDLHAYSKVAISKVQFEETGLNEVVDKVLTDLEILISETRGKVQVAKLPVIDANKTQMQQLFQNLIANALKFHIKNKPPVINISSELLNNGMWEIKVKDNGIGFDEKYIDRIFKPFQRLHTKTEYEGTGMGTAICYKIVNRHGGDITAISEINKGSTFIIHLPEKQSKKIKKDSSFFNEMVKVA